jgi:hypothetical protein
VTSTPPQGDALRSADKIGARLWTLARLCLVLSLFTAVPAAAQDPPDTTQVADTLQVPGEELPDSVSADTIFYNLPSLESGLPSGFATGVWEWDRDRIMASGANTLAELLADVPGLIGLGGGDYGTPLAVSAFGLGGGGVRIFRDGFEAYPVEGGVADLQHIGLAGIQRVRLDRSLSVLTIEMWSHTYDDGRPFSVVEAGTGDLDTNMFRGVFAEPTALGGSIALGIERVDTRGTRPEEGGNRTGTWVRYQLHMRDRAGVGVEFRRMGSQTKVTDYAPSLSRTDVALRGRVELVTGVVAEAYTGRSTFDADDAGADYELYGGSRTQHGFRLALQRDPLWARGELRLIDRGDLPSRSVDVEGGLASARWGGVAGRLRLGRWRNRSTSAFGGRAWAAPLAAVTVFGEFESGTSGGRDAPVLDGTAFPPPPLLPQTADPPPRPAIVDRTTMRLGGVVTWFGVSVAGAALFLDADQYVPLALELDFPSPAAPGSERVGFEGWGSAPMPLRGLRLQGSYQRWDEAGPYLPREIYQASLEFHRTYLDTENFELWWSLGVRGHDPMPVFVPGDGTEGSAGLEIVPFYQNWYARIQARIVTVRLFIGLENFSQRANLQKFPGRLLPFTRSFFGLRWDMWS